ncbi:uncharacterized protein I206_106490 [Kwoniella pini CBS 10737]|uniref:Pentatricopeptide repeat domain-containing protein n=1 Tax=Kwoniella pini CBS 10737 TaxID=1296096 RepID=A0A1B9HUH0_9TREE|nr:uncharacterized protein I206_07295 [Kwoniella pini CBS 10737]OCF46908.1 hypothetical protein I206_07295 [Kwoniella pini CBS 10737]
MFRPYIARKVLRFRSVRLRRSLHNYETESSNPLPILTHLSPSSEKSSKSFPLYQNPIKNSEYIPLNKETLNSLPSDENIQRELKLRLTKKTIENLPELTENDLKNFYSDLIKTGISNNNEFIDKLKITNDSSNEENLYLPLNKKEKNEILLNLENRLLSQGQFENENENENEIHNIDSLNSIKKSINEIPRHYKIFSILAQLVIPDEGPSGTSKSPAGAVQPISHSGMNIPLGLVSKREWNVLFDEFIQKADARGAEALLDVMTLHGIPVEEDKIGQIISVDATAGRVDEVGRLTSELAQSGMQINDNHKDLYILSLLQQNPSQPEIAISQITSAEIASQPYPQSSYKVILKHLTQPSPIFQPNSHSRALAWDLFTNMRLVAHPTPSRELYTTMIKTCADSNQPEPERARDLWIEMTESEKIQPTREEYSAIIRALGSTKKDYLEAFDLLRQMLAKHHDITYTPFAEGLEDIPKFSEYVPTLETFVGLLEGTKRAGDMNRARWILTETVKLARTGQILKSKEWKDGIDADLLSGVFMTYASWKPLVRRGVVKLRDQDEQMTETQVEQTPDIAHSGQVSVENQEEEWLDVNVMEELVESSSHNSQAVEEHPNSQPDLPLTPQSSADALREATALFQRLLDDIASPSSSTDYLPFKNVVLGPKLINSYISVHLAHSSSLASTKQVYEDVWQTVLKLTNGEVKPNGWTYMQILEKCAHGNRGGINDSDRSVAFEWGKLIWEEYLKWFEINSKKLEEIIEPSIKERKKWLMGLGNRQIERIWKSIIKIYALHGKNNFDIKKSFEIFENFYKIYSPEEIIKSYKPFKIINEFKIKSSSTTNLLEINVPPYLIFNDIKLLYEKLLKNDDNDDENIKIKNKLIFMIKKYEFNLNKRRKFRFKGIGQNRELNKIKFLQRENNRRLISNEEENYDQNINDINHVD